MKNIKFVLASIAFVGAIGTAFATKPMNQRNLYQINAQSACVLISCSTVDRDAGTCGVTGTKYSNSSCTTQFTGTAYAITNP